MMFTVLLGMYWSGVHSALSTVQHSTQKDRRKWTGGTRVTSQQVAARSFIELDSAYKIKLLPFNYFPSSSSSSSFSSSSSSSSCLTPSSSYNSPFGCGTRCGKRVYFINWNQKVFKKKNEETGEVMNW